MSKKEAATESPGLTVIGAEPPGSGREVVAALSIHYRDGVPVIIATGGAAIPGVISVEDADGTTVGCYTAGETRPSTRIVGGEESPAGAFPFMIDVK